MNCFAIELIHSESKQILDPFIPLTSSYIENHACIYFFYSYEDVQFLSKELEPFQVIENVHSLYRLEHPKVSDVFEDYGFITNQGSYYLIKDMVIAFQLTEGEHESIHMALLQIDEHLIAQVQSYYFVDLHQRDLIERIAKAYQVMVSFLDLDKML
jgi:hypothetical protein